VPLSPPKYSERRQATVLFADFVGFTEFTARTGAEHAHSLMQRVGTLLKGTVQELGCVVMSFTGDGIVAFFGVPAALEDAPLRACRAALLIEQRIAAAADEIAAQHGVRPQLRMSINSGLVVFGELTEGEIASATAHGDTVNVAARLLDVAEPGAILIGEQTHRYVEGVVETRYAGAFKCKGIAEPQPAYRLIALRQETTRFAAARQRGLSDFVGRVDELKALETKFRELRSLGIVDIAGEPGIGKSRLLHELRKCLAGERALVMSGGCSYDGQRTPFLPFIEVVRRSFQLETGEARTAVISKIEAGLTRLALDAPQNRDLLLNLLGLGGQGALPGFDGTLVGLRTRDLLLQFIEAHCGLSTVVLLLEDLHWIDNASEELLERIIGRDHALLLLVVHTRRPEYRPPWCGRQDVMTLHLGPLSERQTLQIVGSRFGVADIPEALGRLIATKAEGNALFAEEIATFLVERGIVRRTASSLEYDVSSVAAALPGTLQALLTAGVDRLRASDRSLLQVASVIGRRFDLPLLTAILGTATENDVARSLAAIDGTELVYRERNSDYYVFKHVLVRDALYDSLLGVARAELHLKAAQEIEKRSAGRISEVAENLAYHYSRTDRPEPTLRYLCLAGRKCLDIYSLEEGHLYFQQAINVYETMVQWEDGAGIAKAVVGLLEALYLAGNVLEVKRVAERHIPHLERGGASPELAFALYFLSLMLANLCSFREGEARARQALSVAVQTRDVKAIAYARSALFFLATVQGRTSREAMEVLGAQLLAECEAAAENYILNWAYWSIAYNYMACGLIREARGWIAKLVEAGRERNDPRALGMAYWTLSWAEIYAYNYSEAEKNADEALKTAVTPFDRNAASQVKAVAMLLQGRVEEGLGRMRATRQWALDNGWLFAASGVDMSMAGALALGGDVRSAIALLKSGIKTADANGSRAVASWNRIVLAELYLGALTATRLPPPRVVLRNFSTIVGISLFGTRWVRALLAEAGEVEQFEELGLMRGRIEFDLGKLARCEKQFDEARGHLARARAAAEAQGASFFVGEIDAALAK